MKRLMVLCVTLFFSFILVACGSGGEETTTVMRAEQNGVIIEITLEAEGDEVVKQTADNIITYEALGVSNAEEAEAQLGEIVAGFNEVEGVTHSIDYQEGQAIETLAVNYEEADLEEVAQLEGSTFEDTDADYISLEKTIEMLQGQGFGIVE
ncbi:YehR family lipoprotein [Oceanobacillus sp. CAU 1775]